MLTRDDFDIWYRPSRLEGGIRHHIYFEMLPRSVTRPFVGLETLQRNLSIGGQCTYGTYIFDTKTREITFEKKGILKDANKR